MTRFLLTCAFAASAFAQVPAGIDGPPVRLDAAYRARIIEAGRAYAVAALRDFA